MTGVLPLPAAPASTVPASSAVAHVHAGGEVSFALVGWLLPVAVVVALVMAHAVLVTGRRRATGRRWSVGRTVAWVGGVLLLAAAVSPPVTAWAHAGARGHMVQHLLLGMYAPVGLVLAAPVTLVLGASTPVNRHRLAVVLGSAPVRVLSHPVVAGGIDVGGLYVLYLTGLYAASMGTPWVHVVVNLHFLLAGTLFTWAVVGPDPAPHRPGVRIRALALVLAAGAHAVLAKILYAHASSLPTGAGHDATEMQQAATWMYYGGDVAELALAVALFAAWYRAAGRVRRRVAPAPTGAPLAP